MPDDEALFVLYPHCRHCAWGNPHHPDDAAGHVTPCWSGCSSGPAS